MTALGYILPYLFLAALIYYIINKVRHNAAKKEFEEYQAKKERGED